MAQQHEQGPAAARHRPGRHGPAPGHTAARTGPIRAADLDTLDQLGRVLGDLRALIHTAHATFTLDGRKRREQ